MPIRKLNYTGRIRIAQEDVAITIQPNEHGYPTFDLTLNLDNYDLPSDALVFVEAYRQNTLMRFDCGRVGEPKSLVNNALAEFDSTDALHFRIKVTSVSSPRRLILAEAREITPNTRGTAADQQRLSLLPVRSSSELQELAYRIDFTDMPILEINTRLGNKNDIGKNPFFAALVFPSVLRQILTRILLVDGRKDTDGEDWPSRWLAFALKIPDVEDLPSNSESELPEDYQDWIDNAVHAFSKQYTLVSITEASVLGGKQR